MGPEAGSPGAFFPVEYPLAPGGGLFSFPPSGTGPLFGRQITLGGTPFTVIGVAAERFRGLLGIEAPVDLWVPVTMYREASPVFRDTFAWNPLGGSRGFAPFGGVEPGLTQPGQ